MGVKWEEDVSIRVILLPFAQAFRERSGRLSLLGRLNVSGVMEGRAALQKQGGVRGLCSHEHSGSAFPMYKLGYSLSWTALNRTLCNSRREPGAQRRVCGAGARSLHQHRRPRCPSALPEAATGPQNAHAASHQTRSSACLRLSPEDRLSVPSLAPLPSWQDTGTAHARHSDTPRTTGLPRSFN